MAGSMSNSTAARLPVVPRPAARPAKSPLGGVLGRVHLVTLPSDVLIEEMPKKAPPPPPRMYMTVSAPPEVRLPAEEMLAVLFDRLHDLELTADALDGARLVLEV